MLHRIRESFPLVGAGLGERRGTGITVSLHWKVRLGGLILCYLEPSLRGNTEHWGGLGERKSEAHTRMFSNRGLKQREGGGQKISKGVADSGI